MSTSTPSVRESEPQPPHLEIPVERVWPGRFWLFAGLVIAAFGGVWAWRSGVVNPSRLWARQVAPLKTVTVDEGELFVVVTENGSLESSNNATIRCQVEALIGLVGGAAQQGGAAGGRPGGVGPGGAGAGGQGGRPGGTGLGGQGGQAPQQQQAPAPAKKKAGAGGAGAAKGAAGGGTANALVTGGQPNAGGGNAGAAGGNSGMAGGGGGNTGGAGGGAGGGGTGGGGSGGSTAGTGGTSTAPISVKPVIRSFTYVIPPYMPLRPKAPGAAQQPVKQVIVDPNAGGGRRGGRNADPNGAEKPGSTRIIEILPEGTRVKAGDVVCLLDSAAFRDEVQAQKIRWEQAQALVEQAKAILDVNEITYQEYNEGIYPQDIQLLRQYVITCGIDAERARKNLEWSRQTQAKGFRSSAQVKADADAYQQARLTEHEARDMLARLEQYTGPRLKKNLLAKIEAIKADKLAQDSVFQLESDRLRRLELMVANCTLRAPRDGIVVYANVANGWGQTQNPIQEGVTVRQGQALINLPDPKHMQVQARINESKVSAIRIGQKARIVVDAFPAVPMMGTVKGLTPIPAPTGRSGQDVRVYYATVAIDSGGFDELRPGLSAEVAFLVDRPRRVTRLPLQAVRWFGDAPFAAVLAHGPNAVEWRRLVVGQSDTGYMEVTSGVRPGDRVVARPDLLDAPARSVTAPAVAEARPPGIPRG